MGGAAATASFMNSLSADERVRVRSLALEVSGDLHEWSPAYGSAFDPSRFAALGMAVAATSA